MSASDPEVPLTANVQNKTETKNEVGINKEH